MLHQYTIHRVTTLQTLQNSLTFPWQYATLLPTLSGTCGMSVLLVLMSMTRIWTSTWLHYATNDKINMYISSYVQFLYEMLLNTCMNANMQLATNSFWYLFPWQGLSPDNSLTGFKFPDISRFSRQLVTLHTCFHCHTSSAQHSEIALTGHKRMCIYSFISI